MNHRWLVSAEKNHQAVQAYAVHSCCTCCWEAPCPSLMKHGISLAIFTARCSPDPVLWLLLQVFTFCLIRPDNSFCMLSASSKCHLPNAKCFLLTVALVSRLHYKDLIDKVLLRWSSFWQVLPSLLRTPETLFKWSFGSWSSQWPGPCCLVTIFGWTTKSRKTHDGSKCLLFHNCWGSCTPGNSQSFRSGFIPCPDLWIATKLYRRGLQRVGLRQTPIKF